MRRTASTAVLAVAFGTLAGLAQQPATPQPPATQAPPPVFRSGADVIAIDVAVTTDKGDVVPALTASDFKVEIDGKPRQVVSAEWIRQDPAPPGASTASARNAGADASSNEASSSGRLVLLAFDAEGLSVGAGRGAALTAGKFLDQLAPTDQVGLIEVPRGKEVPFTLDRGAIRDALSHIVGQQMHVPPLLHSIGVSEAFDVDAGNTFALNRMVERECPPGYQVRDPSCPKTVQQEADTIVEMYRNAKQHDPAGIRRAAWGSGED